jgi:hypothetical protein
MATNLSGNFLVPGEPFDVSKFNLLFTAVQELQSTTNSLSNTLATSTGQTKTTMPVMWGQRVKANLKPNADNGPFTFNWGKGPYTSAEYTSGNMIVTASMAEDKEGANDYRISITSTGEPKLYVYWVPSVKTATSTSKYFNVMFYYDREVVPKA